MEVNILRPEQQHLQLQDGATLVSPVSGLYHVTIRMRMATEPC